MSRQSDKHYNDFGGLDTRSNKLMQNPKYARGGVNFRYNYQDELCKMNGFQKKIPAAGAECGLMEYKFRDIDTGESQTELLGVSSAGNLNRLRMQFLELTKAGGLVTSYSLFYDETVPTWRISFFNAAGAQIGTVAFAETVTLTTLATSINGLAIAGLTADVVDSSGTTVASTLFAYTLDTVISGAIVTGATLNPAWYWEQVVFPDASEVPFPMVVSQASNPNYEGVTWTNLNNSIYITDGGWMMKYDGFQVARAGMPKMIGPANVSNENVTGFDFTTVTGLNYWSAGDHAARLQFGYVDPTGVRVLGKIQPLFRTNLGTGANVFTTTVPDSLTELYVPSIVQDHTFPIYACQIDGAQSLLAVPTPQTLTIEAGHNLKVGQALRVHESLSGPGGMFPSSDLVYLEITNVTATTVTVTGYPGVGTLSISDDQVYNACYMPSNLMGRYQGRNGAPLYGPFIRMMATQTLPGILPPQDEAAQVPYYIFDGFLPVPAISSQEYSVPVGLSDGGMASLFSTFPEGDVEEEGSDLPRAGRYISSWQNTLVQAGRTYDPLLSQEYYPSVYDPAAVLAANDNSVEAELAITYTESSLCDFQSIYWADAALPEGFPQDGLHEFLIDTVFNDEMRGMAPNKDSFFAFKSRSTGYLTGSLAENTIQLEIMESDCGAACHKAIQDIEGALFYMDANSGFWSVVAGRLPVFIGYGIQDYFKQNALNLNFRKAKAADFRFQDQYVCFIPGSPEGIIFTYDYAATATGSRSAWYPWEAVDGNGGILATANDELLFSSLDTPTLWKQKFTGTKYDYSIHTSPVPFEYLGSWINFGIPTIDKKFVKVWVNSIQGGFDILVSQYANYLSPSIGDMEISFPLESPSKLSVKNWMELSEDKLSATSIGFGNNDIYADVRIQGWEIEYNPDFDVQEARK